MPKWAGKWKGGRWYRDELGRPVYFIERRVAGKTRAIKLAGIHDPPENPLGAVAELSRFLDNPEAYAAAQRKAPERPDDPTYITPERIRLYLESIAGAVDDHRAARLAYLNDWAALGLDLRTVDPDTLRGALEGFDGGHRGRVEALNAFARWLAEHRPRELKAWTPLRNHLGTKQTRAKREAYSVKQLRACYERLPATTVRDTFHLRAATGLHQTEIDQLPDARLYDGPMPDEGAGIRTLDAEHEIAGVLQVKHKNGQWHRVSVAESTLRAALRLRTEGVPHRTSVWFFLKPLVPSNLRHTFETLAEDCGEVVTYTGAGVGRALVAQVMGHRAGSTMTSDRYNKSQVPPMIRLPLGF